MGEKNRLSGSRKKYLVLLPAVLVLAAVFYWLAAGSLSGAELDWHPFQWVSYRSGQEVIEKAGIFVPIEIAGVEETHWLQLDTGSHNQLYGVPFKMLDFSYQTVEKSGDSLFVKFAGRIGGQEIDREFRIREDYGAPLRGGPEKIGTLGGGYFDRKVLLLDYPRQRYTITGGIPGYLLDKINFVRARAERRGYYLDLYLETRLNGQSVWLEFDTGTGLVPVLLDRERWREVTGQELDSPDNREIEAANFGRTMHFLGSGAGGDLELGELKIENPVVYTAREIDMPLTIGNQPFADCLVVIDLINDRFGFIKNSGR